MKKRTYWQGASGTYCDLCYWGTDKLDAEGVELWQAHCVEHHPHVTIPLATN